MTPPDDDAPIDTLAGNLLRAGVLLSALVMAAGGGVYLYRHAREPLTQQRPNLFAPFERVEKYSRPLPLFAALAAGEARPLIQIGVVLLIATPVLRVLVTAIAYARRREVVYVVLPLIVLAVLAVGLWTGQR